MKLNKENYAEFVASVVEMHEEGSSKSQVQDAIGSTLYDMYGRDAAKYLSSIPKIIKDAGVKFRKGKGTTWKDMSALAFAENPELTKDEMRTIVEDAGMKDPDWYVNAWHNVFATIAKGV